MMPRGIYFSVGSSLFKFENELFLLIFIRIVFYHKKVKENHRNPAVSQVLV